MYLLHYEFKLPPSFDMQAIRRRIADKRHLFEQHDGLLWKAWLLADGVPSGPHGNSYAPLYLFEHAAAARDFLLGPLYAGVTHTFGWVQPSAGPMMGARVPPLQGVRSCTLGIVDIRSHAALLAHGERPVPADNGLLAQASMLDVSRMQVRHYCFWHHEPEVTARNVDDGCMVFEVGAVSAPGRPLP